MRQFLSRTGLVSIIVATMERSTHGIWTIRKLNRAAGFMLIALVSAAAPVANAQTVLPTDAKTTCTVPGPEFNSWFTTGAVTANGEVNPADSVNFPDVPNCSFYKWTEQMFLWLTSPAPSRYGGGGRIFESPTFFDISGPDQNGVRTYVRHESGRFRFFNLRASQVGPHGLPIIFDKKGRMFEVIRSQITPKGKSLVLDKAGKLNELERVTVERNGKATFLNKAGKKIDVQLAPKLDHRLAPEVNPRLIKTLLRKNLVQSFRAGLRDKLIFVDKFGNVIEVEQGQAGGNSVLMAQNGSLVFFASMVNDVYVYFQTGTVNGGIMPTPTRFPTTQADLNKIVAFAQLHGKTFPDPEALAIEVKTAWVEPTGLDLSKYITITANIPTYDTSNPMLWTPNGSKQTTLAMVGMHVVGSTKGHPEMIWGTFEHFGNTPNGQYTYTNASNQPITIPQSAAGTWLFSASPPAAPFNVERMHFESPNIVASGANTIGPSNTIRWKSWGAASNVAPNPFVSVAGSNTEIISINNSVLGQLAAGDIRSNYMMTGATWTALGAFPNNTNQVGTSKLSNTTMETYDQGTGTTAASGSNCFSCHASNEVSVSHFFDFLTPLFPLPPPPPRQCPTGRKCCEPAPDGGCDLCVPNNAQCP
jgi:hypothetical protein